MREIRTSGLTRGRAAEFVPHPLYSTGRHFAIEPRDALNVQQVADHRFRRRIRRATREAHRPKTIADRERPAGDMLARFHHVDAFEKILIG